jgi:lipopolysaccharide transport system permease protein
MHRPRIVIEAGRSGREYWRDLWRYRELFLFLAWRDVVVHYKQTIIGVAWAVVRPLATMIIFTLVFSRVAKLDSPVPYPLLVLSGMLAWQLFASSLAESSNSLVQNSNLISKIYFPRLLIPFSSVAVGLIDFLVCCPIMLGLMLYYGETPTWRLLFLPGFLVVTVATALGFGLWLCALNVRFRDVRYIIPFIVQFGLFLSPVGFSSKKIPDEYQWVFNLNPLVPLIEGFRWSLLGTPSPFDGRGWILTLATVAFLLVSGAWYFRRTERTFADVI